jgi:hypothetical protein
VRNGVKAEGEHKWSWQIFYKKRSSLNNLLDRVRNGAMYVQKS